MATQTHQRQSKQPAPESLYLAITSWMPLTLKAPSGKAWRLSGMAPAGGMEWEGVGSGVRGPGLNRSFRQVHAEGTAAVPLQGTTTACVLPAWPSCRRTRRVVEGEGESQAVGGKVVQVHATLGWHLLQGRH